MNDNITEFTAQEWQAIATEVALADGKTADEWPLYLRDVKLSVIALNAAFRILRQRLTGSNSSG